MAVSAPFHPPRPPRTATAPLAGGASLLLVGRFGARALSFGLTILLGRLLAPALFGVYSPGFTLLQLLSLAASLGLEHGVVRFGAGDPAALAAVGRRSLLLVLGSGGMAALLLALVAPSLAPLLSDDPRLVPALRGFAACLLAWPALRVAAGGLRADLAMGASVLCEDLAQPLLHLTAFGLLWAAGWRLGAAVGGAVVSFLGSAVFARLLQRPRLRRAAAGPSVPPRPLLAFSLPAALAGTLSLVALLVDRLCVAAFLDDAATGVYHQASQIAFLFVLVLTAFSGIVAPLVAARYRSGRIDEVAVLYRTATKWGLYLALPAFAVIAVFPGDLLAVLLGEAYREGAAPLLILAIGQIGNLATGAIGFLLVMSGRQLRWLLLSSIGFLTNLGANLILIPRLGLAGAALATDLAIVVLFGSGVLVVRRSDGFWPWDRRVTKGLLACAGGLGSAALVRLFVAAPLARLATAVPLVLAVFAALLYVLGADDEDRELLDLVRRRRAPTG